MADTSLAGQTFSSADRFQYAALWNGKGLACETRQTHLWRLARAREGEKYTVRVHKHS